MNAPSPEESTLIRDYKNFKNEPSVESRATLVKRITQKFINDEFDAAEKDIAIDILDVLSYDVEKNIRYTIANELRSCNDLPHDIALRLAHDIAEVSSPILQFSEVLTDEDLQEIITCSQEMDKIDFIAQRSYVSPTISSSIIDTHHERSIELLIDNKGAKINDNSYEKLINYPNTSPQLLNKLVDRGGLSHSIAVKLISVVSNEVKKQIASTYDLDEDILKPYINAATEQETITLARSDDSTIRLVDHLYDTGKLNHSIILRALCKTDILFFICGLARLADIPISNARTLITRGDEQAFEALFTSASMPTSMLEATKIILSIIKESPPTEDTDAASYSRFLIGQIVRNQFDRSIPNMRYFVTLIGNNTTQHSSSSDLH